MGNVARIMRHDYAEVERGRVSLHIESRFQGHKFCLNYSYITSLTGLTWCGCSSRVSPVSFSFSFWKLKLPRDTYNFTNYSSINFNYFTFSRSSLRSVKYYYDNICVYTNFILDDYDVYLLAKVFNFKDFLIPSPLSSWNAIYPR